jgi:HNH endonuclease
MIETTCAICGKGFEIPDHYPRLGRGRFCSMPCYRRSRRGGREEPRTSEEKLALKRAYRDAHQEDTRLYNARRNDTERPRRYTAPLQRVSLICQYCHRDFLCFPYEANTGRKYCSKECKYQDKKRVSYTCDRCGEPMHVTPSRLTFSDHVFCSPECLNTWRSTTQRGEAHPMWKGGISPFTYSREFHQKRPLILARDNYLCQVCGQHRNHMSVHHIDENPENHDDNNLVTVCPTCHRGVIHGTNEVTFDSQRRAIWKADGSYCKERMPK